MVKIMFELFITFGYNNEFCYYFRDNNMEEVERIKEFFLETYDSIEYGKRIKVEILKNSKTIVDFLLEI